MGIAIAQDTAIFTMNEDYEFHCAHVNAEVDPPCCNGTDCGCHGRASVWCYDCNNTDITQDEVNDICERMGY